MSRRLKLFNIFTIAFPTKRTFSRRAFIALVVLYFLGNLAGIPLLRKTNTPIEPLWFWGVATAVSAVVIALSLAMANRTGLGAPLLEGTLPKEDLPSWLRSGLALTTLMFLLAFPFSLVANLEIDPDTYPFGWELFLASFKAGVVEEIVGRLFLVSLFVWLVGFFSRDDDGRPTRGVYWIAILLAGLVFGWGHVDAILSNPAADSLGLGLIMVLSSALGVCFGWLYWKLGLEWAMFAHFSYDVFVSMILIPVYLLQSPIVWSALLVGLVVASVVAWRYITRDQLNARLHSSQKSNATPD